MAIDRGWPYANVCSAKNAIRAPSRTIPDGVRALLDRPDLFLVKERRDWDLLKYSRLIAGECYPCSGSFWVDIPNCWVHVPSGTVITSEREVLYESTLSMESLYAGYSNQDFDGAATIDDDLILLATAFGRNYAHWLFDALPKLAAECVEGRKLLLGDPLLSFQRESLNLLGFSDDQILSVHGQLVRCRNLRVSIAAFTSGIPHPDAILCIRRKFLTQRSRAEPNVGRFDQGGAGVPPAFSRQHSGRDVRLTLENRSQIALASAASPSRRIYLSRQNTRRRVVNQSALDPHLRELNFEHVVAEDHGPFQMASAHYSTARSCFLSKCGATGIC